MVSNQIGDRNPGVGARSGRSSGGRDGGHVAFTVMSRAWLVGPSGPLRGDVYIRGSKNAVTKHMVAALLGEGPSTIRQVPEVGDVAITADILRSLGVHV